MKNIIILGPSRVGKSSLASLLTKKCNYNYFSGDSLRNAFINIYPELNYTVHNTIERLDFCKFIKFIIDENKIHLKRDIYYVIDSTDISISTAKEVFSDCLIIVLGVKDISVKELVSHIKNYDTNLDWTYGYSEQELMDIARETIAKSEELYKASLENQLLYFDTSKNRDKVFEDILNIVKKELGISYE